MLCAVPCVATQLSAQSVGVDRALTVREGVATFAARATFGGFTGRTSAVTGAVSATGGPLEATGWVEVLLDSLRTGNGTRDRHMRDAFETPRFPTARFELDSLRLTGARDASVPWDTPTPVQLYGRFRVHGVWRPIVAVGTINASSPLSWQLRASFPVTLANHDITKGISRAFGTVRVEQEVRVTIEAVFSGP